MCSEVCYYQGTMVWRNQKLVITEGGGVFWRAEGQSMKKTDMACQRQEWSGGQCAWDRGKTRKRAKGGRKTGKKEAVIKYLPYSFILLGIFDTLSI